jgi:glycosyltransferase involved in cell wall biosynthesis
VNFLREQDSALPFVSIVVITLNRKKRLVNCLNSLFNLNYPQSKFNIVVVDGGSNDGTREIVIEEYPKVDFVIERRRGMAYARNTGWKHARGEVIAYTDDDCIVDSNWLRRLVYSLNSTGAASAGGPLIYVHQDLIPPIFNGTPVGPFNLGEKERPLKIHENLITANIAVRSDVFKRVQFFESLVFNDSEDSEFCKSLMEVGYKLIYVPDAKVYHDIELKRITLGYLLKRAFFSGLSMYIVERKRKSKLKLIPQFLRASIDGYINFMYMRKLAEFYWTFKCFVAFLSSVILIPIWG